MLPPQAIVGFRHDITGRDALLLIDRVSADLGYPTSMSCQGSTFFDGSSGRISWSEIEELVASGRWIFSVHGYYHKWVDVAEGGVWGSARGDVMRTSNRCQNPEEVLFEVNRLKEIIEGNELLSVPVVSYQTPYNFGSRTLIGYLDRAGFRYANSAVSGNIRTMLVKCQARILAFDGLVVEADETELEAFSGNGSVQLQSAPTSNYDIDIDQIRTEQASVAYIAGDNLQLTNQVTDPSDFVGGWVTQFAALSQNETQGATTLHINIDPAEFTVGGYVVFNAVTTTDAAAAREITNVDRVNRTVTISPGLSVAQSAGRVLAQSLQFHNREVWSNHTRFMARAQYDPDFSARLNAPTNHGYSVVERNTAGTDWRTWAEVEADLQTLLVGTGYIGTLTYHDVGPDTATPSQAESRESHLRRVVGWLRDNNVTIRNVNEISNIVATPGRYPAANKTFNACPNGQLRYADTSTPTRPALVPASNWPTITFRRHTEDGAPTSMADGQACGWVTGATSSAKPIFVIRFWGTSRYRVRFQMRKTPGDPYTGTNVQVSISQYRWPTGPWYWQRLLCNRTITLAELTNDWTTYEITDGLTGWPSGIQVRGIADAVIYFSPSHATGSLDISDIYINRVN